MSKLRWVQCALGLSLLVAVGCSKDSGGGGPVTLKSNLGVDMRNVAGFVIAPQSSPKLATGVSAAQAPVSDGGQQRGANTLYALGADGGLTVVTVIADGGSSSTTVSPVAAFDTPRFTFFAYAGVTCQQTPDTVVALRKSDGALFCIPGMGAFTDYLQQLGTGIDGPNGLGSYFEQIQADPTGNLVWINNADLAVVDFSDPNNPTVTNPLGTGGTKVHNGGFAVNAAGDALVAEWGGTGTGMVRVQRPSGGFVNLSTENVNCVTAGASGDPDDFYYFDSNNPQHLVQVVSDGGYAIGNVTTMSPGSSNGWSCAGGLAQAGGHLLFTSNGSGVGTPANAFVDFVPATGTVTVQTVSALNAISRIAAGGSFVMILGTDSAGNGGIVRYDVTDSSFTTLLAPGDYTLQAAAFSVAGNGDLTFQGQRASDGAFIVGTIPAGTTTVNVITTGLPPVYQVQRIN